MAFYVSEQELLRRRAAMDLIFFGKVGGMHGRDAIEFDRRLNTGGKITEQERAELDFADAVQRVINGRETANEQEAAILRACDAFSEPPPSGVGQVEARFYAEREKAIHSIPNEGTWEEREQEFDRRRKAFPIPDDVKKDAQACEEYEARAEDAFFTLLLDYYEQQGTLPQRLRPNHSSTASATAKRGVPRINSAPFDGSVRVPTIGSANGVLTALMLPNRWKPTDAGDAIYTRVRDTQIAIKCDTEMGFNPERAIQRIAKHGPAIAQTFVAMVNLWMRENKGKDYETYMTGRASDLLRAQGRVDKNGGFPLDEQLEKGRQVYDLSMLTVPRTVEIKYGRGQKQTRGTVAIGPLVMVQPIEIGPNDASGEDGSMVTFRFHITRDIHDAVCGEDGKYAELSSRLLTYHPVKDKYQIMIGFSLAYYDRVNRKQSRTHHPISLPALLNMACIDGPEMNPLRFLEQIETAINDLSRDGVIPGLRLERPENWAELIKARKSRDVLEQSKILFPRMIAAPETARTQIAPKNGGQKDKNPALAV